MDEAGEKIREPFEWEEPKRRGIYINKEDVKDTYGAVQGCRGCEAALRGEESRPHNARCRALKEQQIQERDPDRYNAALERMVKEVEKKKRKVEEEGHSKEEHLQEENLDAGASSSSEHLQSPASSNRASVAGAGMEHSSEEERQRKIRAQAVDDVPMGIAKAVRMDIEGEGNIAGEKRAGEEREERERGKVRRVEGESTGNLMAEMHIDGLEDEQWEQEKEKMRE